MITRPVATSGSIRPEARLPATAVDTKAPAKLAIAATPTATRGGSARVETVVATAFAVSWKPLVKSKMRAMAMTATRRASLTGS